MRRTVVLTALVALAMPAPVQAAARGDDDNRPFRRGTILPSIALGGSFSRNYGGTLLVGAGASYFVAGGLAIGLHLRNLSTFYSQSYKEYVGPTIFSQIPTNEFSLTPSLLWILYRGERVAPYFSFGIGPVFLNKQRGVLGQWTVGPGVMIGTGGPLWIDLGLGFGMRFTNDRCQEAYTFIDPQLGTYHADYACSFTWGFRGGLVFGIGGRREPRPSSRPAPPPSYTAPPASSYPAPAAEPVPNASPPSAASPVEPAPEGPPPPVPEEGTPPAGAPPTPAPAETAPVPPAGESLPIPPPA